MKQSKNFMSKVAMSILLTSNLFGLAQPLIHADKDDWHYVPDEEICEVEKIDNSANTGTPSGADGDWLTEGTEAYNVAKATFEHWTKGMGVSGAFAAGALANSNGESRLVPDLGESAFDKPYAVRRFGMDNDQRVDGMGPSTAQQAASYGYDYFGGGLYQITPYQKYTKSPFWKKDGRLGWEPANQIEFIWDEEFANKRVFHFYMNNTATNGAQAAVNRLGRFTSVEEAISTDDPAKAVAFFQTGYERPQDYHTDREEYARQANAVFNKENIKADPSKWKFGGGSANTTVSTESSKNDKKSKCKPKKDKRAGWGNDGTGTYTQAGVWRPENLPDELKKYAIDVTSLGMKFGSSEGWPNFGDQCVHFTESVFALLWTKDGHTPQPIVKNATGLITAKGEAKAYGGQITHTPTKGAISGTISTTSAGHTYIVSHVFENGDILIIEQNFTGYSGAGNGEAGTWNYRIITKDTYSRENHDFFTAEDLGFKPNDSVRMMGN